MELFFKGGKEVMKIITVCGSMRFIREMMEISLKVELEGNVVLMPIYNSYRPSKDAFSDEENSILDKMHRERIKLSDAILVVNVNGYVGNSTREEIEYAKSLNKEILYYSDLV